MRFIVDVDIIFLKVMLGSNIVDKNFIFVGEEFNVGGIRSLCGFS